MPDALAKDVPYELFWHLNPVKLRAFDKAYRQKRKIIDEILWFLGQYVSRSLSATVCNHPFWKGKHGKPHEYPEVPFMQKKDVEEKQLPEEELQRQRELFVARLMAMKTNFELNKPKESE